MSGLPPPPPPPLTPTSLVPSNLPVNPDLRAVPDFAADRRDVISKIQRIAKYVLPTRIETSYEPTNPDRPEETVSPILNEGGNAAWWCSVCMVHTAPVQQIGPSCGFAALAVVGQLLIPKPTLSSGEVVREMTQWAKEQHFTNFGEMFSTENLFVTLNHHFQSSAELVVFSATQEASAEGVAVRLIKEQVEKRRLVVLPYDKGPNHEPVLRNGHSAHWCVVLGLVCLKTKAASGVNVTYAICRHGGSNKHALWNLQDLVASNLALREFGPKRLESDVVYVVEDYKDLKNLRGTAIFVNVAEEAAIWRCENDLNELVLNLF